MFFLRVLILFIVLFFLVAAGWAGPTVKEGTQEIGRGFKTMGSETGKAIKDGSKEVGRGLNKIGRATGQAINEKGREAGREMKKAGQSASRQAKMTSHSVSNWFRATYHKTMKALNKIGTQVRDYFARR